MQHAVVALLAVAAARLAAALLAVACVPRGPRRQQLQVRAQQPYDNLNLGGRGLCDWEYLEVYL